MHILPVAGSATRFGGIPKYLLPSSKDGKSLLQLHIESAMSVDLGEIVVLCHPSMYEFLNEFLSGYSSRLVVDKIESKTMTETILQGAIRHGSRKEIISITLPDTMTTSGLNKDFPQLLESLRAKENSLLLYPFLEKHLGKFGQVLIMPENGKVLDIVDKSLNCDYPFIWGGISLSYERIRNFDASEPTIGNCIKASLHKDDGFNSVISFDEYFDCGNMKDYLEFLGKNLIEE